jgi:hypothetical protein
MSKAGPWGYNELTGIKGIYSFTLGQGFFSFWPMSFLARSEAANMSFG